MFRKRGTQPEGHDDAYIERDGQRWIKFVFNDLNYSSGDSINLYPTDGRDIFCDVVVVVAVLVVYGNGLSCHVVSRYTRRRQDASKRAVERLLRWQNKKQTSSKQHVQQAPYPKTHVDHLSDERGQIRGS